MNNVLKTADILKSVVNIEYDDNIDLKLGKVKYNNFINIKEGFELVKVLNGITDIPYEDCIKVIDVLSKSKTKEEIIAFIDDVNEIQNDTPVLLKRANM